MKEIKLKVTVDGKQAEVTFQRLREELDAQGLSLRNKNKEEVDAEQITREYANAAEETLRVEKDRLEVLQAQQRIAGQSTAETEKRLSTVNQMIGGYDRLNITQRDNVALQNRSAYAMSNFGRVIADSNYGIIGMANNIGPLTDSFVMLRQQAGGTSAAFASMAASAFSPAGAAVLIGSVLPAALVFLSDKFESTSESVEKLQKRMQSLSIPQLADEINTLTKEISKTVGNTSAADWWTRVLPTQFQADNAAKNLANVAVNVALLRQRLDELNEQEQEKLQERLIELQIEADGTLDQFEREKVLAAERRKVAEDDLSDRLAKGQISQALYEKELNMLYDIYDLEVKRQDAKRADQSSKERLAQIDAEFQKELDNTDKMQKLLDKPADFSSTKRAGRFDKKKEIKKQADEQADAVREGNDKVRAELDRFAAEIEERAQRLEQAAIGIGSAFGTGIADSIAAGKPSIKNALKEILITILNFLEAEYVAAQAKAGIDAILGDPTKLAALTLGVAALESAKAAINSFRVGGYTGDGASSEPAGKVEKGEYVFSAFDTARIGLERLERFRRSTPPSKSIMDPQRQPSSADQISKLASRPIVVKVGDYEFMQAKQLAEDRLDKRRP